jgi:hypothetical protein
MRATVLGIIGLHQSDEQLCFQQMAAGCRLYNVENDVSVLAVGGNKVVKPS